MKNRLITAFVGILVVVGWLFAIYTPVFSGVIALISFIGVWEMLKVFNVKNIPFKVLCLALSVGIILFADYGAKLNVPLFPVATIVIIVSLIVMVLNFEKLKFEQVVSSLFSAFAIPSSLSCILFFRDMYISSPEAYTKSDGIFLILFAFFGAWMTDSFALISGMLFGKHKLAPKISPKKTVEGAVGGCLCNIIACGILFFVFDKFYNLSDEISLVETLITAGILSVISMFGDLAASTIKRHQGIKDFGNLLPGHGGIMDRFDSTLFVLPTLYSAVLLIL